MSPDRTFTISLSFTFSQLPWIGFLWKFLGSGYGGLWVFWSLFHNFLRTPQPSHQQGCSGRTLSCRVVPGFLAPQLLHVSFSLTAPLVTPPLLDNCIPFSEEAGWAKAARDGREEQAGPLWPHQDIWQKKVSSIALLVVVVPACERFLPGLDLAMCHGVRNCEGDFVSTQRSRQKSPSIHAFDFCGCDYFRSIMI